MHELQSGSPGHGQQAHVLSTGRMLKLPLLVGRQMAGDRALGQGRPAAASSMATPATWGPFCFHIGVALCPTLKG